MEQSKRLVEGVGASWGCMVHAVRGAWAQPVQERPEGRAHLVFEGTANELNESEQRWTALFLPQTRN
eukprot:scaffold19219_cov52-Phaeocystis_antarctica.AAC.2